PYGVLRCAAPTTSRSRYRPQPPPAALPDVPSFPTRRSSDLTRGDHPGMFNVAADGVVLLSQAIRFCGKLPQNRMAWDSRTTPSADRKSTRLNSSHVKNSYAVFCLKKKKRKKAGSSRSLYPRT